MDCHASIYFESWAVDPRVEIVNRCVGVLTAGQASSAWMQAIFRPGLLAPQETLGKGDECVNVPNLVAAMAEERQVETIGKDFGL